MQKPNQVITDYIVSCLAKGMPSGKILADVGRKWHLSLRTNARLMKVAKEQHIEAQQALKIKLTDIDTQAAIEARKKAIMTTESRKELLTKIINGEIEIENKEPRWDPKQQKFVSLSIISKPTHADIRAAISELNKMEGDYAATKVAQTNSKGEDVTNLSDNQFIQLINAVINAPSTDTGQ